MSDAPVPVRDAATVILVRDAGGPQVLMGQRGATAAFMPSKFVFPGGAVDPGDQSVPLADLPGEATMARLGAGAAGPLAHALVAAAIRETWEETGLILGHPGAWTDAPPDWQGFAATGHRPSGRALRLIFRAITPPGRPRRFDARFFLADAAAVIGDPQDFSRACDELSALQWIPLEAVRSFDLPFITGVVLAEVAATLARDGAPGPVPFFYNDDVTSQFRWLGTAR